MAKNLKITLALLAALLILFAVAGYAKQFPVPSHPVAPLKTEAGETAAKRVVKKDEKEKLHIKIKRGSGGDYTWELSGGDMNEILGADRTLRKKFLNTDTGK